ncbi:MAG: hypothetical protein HYX74_00525 [Acidobacteria bacterium]|nr:hypothetical protein [Acidobacteriota bacterium]
MAKIGRVVSNVLMWKYERGTWQYDIMCALIVAFIVCTPRSFFHGDFRRAEPALSAIQYYLLSERGRGSQMKSAKPAEIPADEPTGKKE